jgi:cytochrome c
MMRKLPLAVLIAVGSVSVAGFVASTAGLLWADNGPGKEVFEKRCTGCHGLDNEKAAPHLRGVYGRRAASLATFSYSDALRKSAITWDAGTLDKWLTDPDSLVPDNDMAFRVAKPDERTAIIAYLKEISGK